MVEPTQVVEQPGSLFPKAAIALISMQETASRDIWAQCIVAQKHLSTYNPQSMDANYLGT